MLTPDSVLGLRKKISVGTEIKGGETEAQASEQKFCLSRLQQKLSSEGHVMCFTLLH